MSEEIIDIIRKIDRTIHGPEKMESSHALFRKNVVNGIREPKQIDIRVLEYAFKEVCYKLDRLESRIDELENK